VRCRQCTADLLQGQVRLLGQQLQYRRTMLDQTRAVIASHRAGAGVTLGPQPLRPPNRRAHTHPKPARRRPRRCPRCYRCCHAITQIPRIWCRHIVPQRYVASPPSPIRASLQIFYLAESTRSETALESPRKSRQLHTRSFQACSRREVTEKLTTSIGYSDLDILKVLGWYLNGPTDLEVPLAISGGPLSRKSKA
jgi:hypothetical protein